VAYWVEAEFSSPFRIGESESGEDSEDSKALVGVTGIDGTRRGCACLLDKRGLRLGFALPVAVDEMTESITHLVTDIGNHEVSPWGLRKGLCRWDLGRAVSLLHNPWR
jgi:hypothetical protein